MNNVRKAGGAAVRRALLRPSLMAWPGGNQVRWLPVARMFMRAHASMISVTFQMRYRRPGRELATGRAMWQFLAQPPRKNRLDQRMNMRAPKSAVFGRVWLLGHPSRAVNCRVAAARPGDSRCYHRVSIHAESVERNDIA